MQLSSAELTETLIENLGGAQLNRGDLDTVRIPSGGATNWSIPGIDGEESEKVLRGVIVYQTVARGYWETSFEDASGAPPTCYSNDGKTGIGTPGGDCATCKFNQWGTDRRGGKGKACRELRLLFLIAKEGFLPRAVALPRTSPTSGHFFSQETGPLTQDPNR
jgi:hypothetical protein